MKEFFEQFASILAAATIGMLILAVCHELGYFWLIGLEFQSLLTTTDYLANGIFWLPLAVFFAYGAVDWTRFRDEPPPPRKKWSERTRGDRIWIVIVGLFFLFVFAAMSWPPSALAFYTAIGAMVFLWSKIWRRFAPASLPEPFNSAARTLVRLGPPAMFGVFVWGWWSADIDLSRTDKAYIYRFKGKQNHELRVPLRNIEKGILVRNPVTKRIEFWRWEQVEEMSKGELERSRSLLCFFLEWCPSRNMLSPH